jgi:hypothetical protein
MFKKHLFTSLFFLVLHWSMNAQITITSADIPKPGALIKTDYVQEDYISGINIGNTGANQTWNFTGALTYGTPDELFYLLPSQAPQPNPIAGADLVSTDEVSDTAYYNYLKSTASVFAQIGSAGPGEKFTFGQPLKYLDLPSTYLSTFTQNTTVSGTSDGITISGTAKNSSKVDAYGTVTTALGTFPCLRVQRITELNLTILFFNVLSRDTTYEWWTNSYDAPVFTVTHTFTSSAGEEDFYIDAFALTQQTTAVQNPNAPESAKMALFPNPSSAQASNLNFQLTKSGKTEITILDMNGTLLRQESLGFLSPGEYNQSLDLGAAPSGTYVVMIRQDGKLFGLKQWVIKN